MKVFQHKGLDRNWNMVSYFLTLLPLCLGRDVQLRRATRPVCASAREVPRVAVVQESRQLWLRIR